MKTPHFATFLAWSCSSREITDLFFQYPGGGGAVPSGPDPPEGFPTYDPYWMSRHDYRKAVRDSALRAITDHILLRQAHRSKTDAFVDSNYF